MKRRIEWTGLISGAAMMACASALAQPCEDSLFLPVTPGLLQHEEYNFSGEQGSSAVGDVNGDGWPDLIGAGAKVVRVLLSDGAGGFHPEFVLQLDAGRKMSELDAPLVGDFDGDGVAEIAVVTRNTSTPPFDLKTEFFELGSDGVSLTSVLPDVPDFDSILAGDFNGDGFVDLFSGSETRLNDGMGGFAVGLPVVGDPAGLYARLVDFNDDGLLDVLSLGSNGAAGEVRVHHGQADGSFELARMVPSSLNPRAITSADLNNDGLRDLIVMRPKPEDDLGVRLATSEATWGPWVYTSNGTFDDTIFTSAETGLVLHDVTGNGHLDAVYTGAYNFRDPCCPRFDTYFLGVREGNGAGGFGVPIAYYLTDQRAGLETRGRRDRAVFGPLLLEDIDLDGDEELIFTMIEESREPFWTAVAEIGCRDREIGDYDDDGNTDAADLATLLAGWGAGAADLNNDGVTDAGDLAILLAAWGSVLD